MYVHYNARNKNYKLFTWGSWWRCHRNPLGPSWHRELTDWLISVSWSSSWSFSSLFSFRTSFLPPCPPPSLLGLEVPPRLPAMPQSDILGTSGGTESQSIMVIYLDLPLVAAALHDGAQPDLLSSLDSGQTGVAGLVSAQSSCRALGATEDWDGVIGTLTVDTGHLELLVVQLDITNIGGGQYLIALVFDFFTSQITDQRCLNNLVNKQRPTCLSGDNWIITG